MPQKISLAQYIARNIWIIKSASINTLVCSARENICRVEKDSLPSVCVPGVKIDIDRSTKDKIHLVCDYHHMNEDGHYCGWRRYTVTVTACLAFGGLDIKVTGNEKGYPGTKEYIGGLFNSVLSEGI